jgi:hypothetical protein
MAVCCWRGLSARSSESTVTNLKNGRRCGISSDHYLKSWILRIRFGGGQCHIQLLGESGFLPGCSIFADCLFLLGLVYGGVDRGERTACLLCLSFPQAVVELLKRCSQAAPIAAIVLSMLQILSVCLECRRMIGHARSLPSISLNKKKAGESPILLKPYTLQSVNINVKPYFPID